MTKRTRIKHAEAHRASSRKWARNNPDRRRDYQHQRRARANNAVPQRWTVHSIIPFACYWCGANLRAYGATTHVDHVMPINLGGPADPSNEVNSCASCNLRKSGKHPLVWIANIC